MNGFAGPAEYDPSRPKDKCCTPSQTTSTTESPATEASSSRGCRGRTKAGCTPIQACQEGACKCKPPQNISPTDSDDSDDRDSDTSGQGGPASSTAATVPDAVVVSFHQEQATTSSKEDSLKEIREWFVTVIGCKPVKGEMEAYAKQFNDLGLHSVGMIVSLCNKEDIAEFNWMKRYHKAKVAAAIPA